MKEKYNHAVIRELADAALGDEDLEKICFDHFGEVHGNFTAGQTKGKRILFLVDHVGRRGLEATLLKAIQKKNPYQYHKFESRLCQNPDHGECAGEPPPPPTNRDSLPPVCGWFPKRWRMPYRSLGDRFINKVRDMWELHDILTAQKKAVVGGVGILKGMGGIGKTQLAIEYADRFRMCYPGGIFWIDTERGRFSVTAQVSEGASDIVIDETLEEDRRLDALWKILGGFPPTLLILDNFLEDQPLRNWLPPSGSVHTLITTRRRDLDYSGVSLKTMTEAEGLALLNSGEREIGAEGKRLVAVLGGLPLAIELAKAYLNNRKNLSVGDLIGAIVERGEMAALDTFADNYSDELPSKHEKHVAATIGISWQAASPTEQAVLRAVSLLAPEPVPARLIRNILDIPSGKVLDDPLDDALCGIDRNLSLADLDNDGDPVMHRLISGFVRTTVSAGDPIFGKVVSAVKHEMSRASDVADTLSFQELEKIVPHAEHLLESDLTNAEQAVDISNHLRWHHQTWGRFRVAEKFGRISLDVAEKNYKPGHAQIAMCQSNLALVLRDLGDLEGARDLLTRALASAEKSYEAGHPSIAISQSNLALVLKELGDLEGARDLLTRALLSDEKSYEPGHPSIARCQSNLATVLQDLGDLEGARDLLTRALLSDEKSYEAGHPSIAIRQSNLAGVLKDLGDLEGARDLLRRSYQTFFEKFGADHPHTRIVKGHLDSVAED